MRYGPGIGAVGKQVLCKAHAQTVGAELRDRVIERLSVELDEAEICRPQRSALEDKPHRRGSDCARPDGVGNLCRRRLAAVKPLFGQLSIGAERSDRDRSGSRSCLAAPNGHAPEYCA